MGGSTLEAMAEAVENAMVVLVCASEKYKLSPNCRTGNHEDTIPYLYLVHDNLRLVLFCICVKVRTGNFSVGLYFYLEAEYTFQLKRPIVPLMMQRRYKPDGWLGMLMGAKQYVNFDGKFDFGYAYDMLVREIHRYMKADDSTDGVCK